MMLQQQQQYYPQQVSYQQTPVTQDEVYANIIQEERVRNIIQQISPQSYLNDIRMLIKGYYYNETNKRWERVDDSIPEPSPLLVSRFISYLGSIVSNNTTLGNLSDNQINKIMKLIIEWVVDDLNSNAEEYGLGSSYTERTRIGHIICNSTFMTMNRALNGQEARRMWGSLSLLENMGMGGNQPKKGAMDFLKFWK